MSLPLRVGFLVLSLLLPLSVWAHGATEIMRSSGVARQTPLDLSREASLQRKVKVNTVGRSLLDTLKQLSQNLPFALRISDTRTKYQRFTLIAQDKPLWQLMSEITSVLSHQSATAPVGRIQYQWKRGVPLPDGKPVYVLTRERAASDAENDAFERPWREMREDLTLLRDINLNRKDISAAVASPSSYLSSLYRSGNIKNSSGPMYRTKQIDF